MKSARVLIVAEAAESARRLNSEWPTEPRIDAEFAPRGQAMGRLTQEDFDLVVLRIEPGADAEAMLALRELRNIQPETPVMILAATPSVETASAGLRLGANDYLSEPIDAESFRSGVLRLLGERRRAEERQLLLRQVERPYSFDNIIGACPAMRKVYETIAQVADSGVDALVVGETGTGKELVARSLHQRSRRAHQPFVPVDCGAIPDNLLESEFFGYEKGAFTGADSRRIGLLEFAEGGTIFLDELGELPLLLQAKLLRTLQERRIRRVGGREEIEIDVRIVAATSRQLEAMIAEGRFREDLYYRINVVRIDLPPLRERGDDIGLLAEYFATRACREMGKPVKGITPEAFQVLKLYPFPGNVRELSNIVKRAIALSQQSMITLGDLPDHVIERAGEKTSPGKTVSEEERGYFALRDAKIAEFERDYFTNLLRKHRGEVTTAAQEARLPRGTLYRLIKLHNIDPARFRNLSESTGKQP